MKPGTIVVVLPLRYKIAEDLKSYVKWLPQDDEKTPYVIRGENYCPISDSRIFYLEEGVIGYNRRGMEIGLGIKDLREILPPEDISEVIEEICLSKNFISNTEK